MNKIEKLIKEFCPDGVEWKKLGEVCEIKRGRVISKQYLEIHQGEYPVYSSQTRDNGKIGSINTYDFDGEYVTWTTDGAYAGTIFYRSGKFSITNICGLIFPKDKNILNLKFVFYWLQITTKKYVKDGSGNPKLMSNVMGNITIPIPSLKTQEKIVKILDNFTKYVTELQAELQARNKQYNYYRDMLLSEDYLNKISEKIHEIEENSTLALVSIKEVCIRQRGFSITASEMKKIHKENAPIKIFAGGKTTANIDECNIDKKYIINKPSIIVKSRGNIDFEFYTNPFSHKNELWSYSSNDDKILNIKYLYYYLKKNIKYFEDKAISGKLPQISTGITDNYKIFIPPIIIQNKIVKILDRFQELLSDTKGLLPLEIEQRRKQYEYYREKLLTFDKEEGYALSTAQHSSEKRIKSLNS